MTTPRTTPTISIRYGATSRPISAATHWRTTTAANGTGKSLCGRKFLTELHEHRPVIRGRRALIDPRARDPGRKVGRDEDVIDTALVREAVDAFLAIAGGLPRIDQSRDCNARIFGVLRREVE